MTEQEYYDLTIIGGGPVGMFAATYARMRLAKTGGTDCALGKANDGFFS